MAAATTILSTLVSSSHTFLQPSSDLHQQALASVKDILDPLAEDVATVQKLRREENRKKRKRGDSEREDAILQLRQVYIKGLPAKQVWEQARRILDATCLEVERDIDTRKENEVAFVDQVNGVDHDIEDADEEIQDLVNDDELLEDEDLEEEDYEDGVSEADDSDEDDQDDPEDFQGEESSSEQDEKVVQTYTQDPNHLNDGFFSIDDFNRQTQFLEQQDARGEDDNSSDEDEIDWDADPLTMQFNHPKANAGKNALSKDDNSDPDDDEDDDDEGGPTFGDVDLDAPDSDEDMQDEDVDNLDRGIPGLDNTNDIRYADFFAPPPKKPSKTKRMRALPKTQPESKPSQTISQNETDLENDLQRAISDVRRDLLESEEEISDDENASNSESDLSDASGRPKKRVGKNLSTHEKQKAQIASEIRRLEAASIAKRDWTLSGEARGADRPMNSLLEEDLEFERVGKPVPVITAEVTEGIEALIKRRILAREFDEVIRRRPDALDPNSTTTRRGRIELDETKPSTGLGEIYEQEHLAATDPNYTSTLSTAVKKQHAEISRLWNEVSSQLDLLSNLHFKPKRTEAEIKTVEDKPTISMEDARPVGLGDNADAGMLAPQEIYRPGEDKRRSNKSTKDDDNNKADDDNNRNIITRPSGMSTSRDELTREEKLRRRRREKERIKKAHQNQGPTSGTMSTNGNNTSSRSGAPKKSKSAANQDIITQLAKGNVKVIGKKGQLESIEGARGGKKNKSTSQSSMLTIGQSRDASALTSGGNLKL